MRRSIRGGPIELEQMDPSDPPLGVHRLHGDGHGQFHCPGTGEWHASALGDLVPPATARLAPVHRSLFVRAAVRRQVAQREESMKKDPKADPTVDSDACQSRVASPSVARQSVEEIFDARGGATSGTAARCGRGRSASVRKMRFCRLCRDGADSSLPTGRSRYPNDCALTSE